MVIKTYEGENKTIRIDYDKCAGFGMCVAFCPVDVFEIVQGRSTAPRAKNCTGCCECVRVCPEGAIEVSSC